MADQDIGTLASHLRLEAAQFKQEISASREALQQVPIAAARVDAALRSSATSWDTVVSSTGKARGELKNTEEQLSRTTRTSNAAASSFHALSQSVGTVIATTVTFNAALRLVETGVNGVKDQINDARTAARDFETGWTGVTKTVDASTEQLAGMSTEIRRLARTELPVAITGLLQLAETGGALGVKAENITSFTTVMAKLGVTTNIVGEEGATMVARFANISHVSQADYDKLASTIVGLGNDGASTEKDILAMGLRLAGAADTAGTSAPKILGLANAMSSVGLEAEAGGTAVSTALADMATAAAGSTAKARQSLIDLAQVAGRSTEEMRQKIKTDAVGAFTDVLEGIAQIKNRGGDVFGVLETLGFADVRQRDAILRMAGNIEEVNRQIGNGQRLYDENTAAQAEFAKRSETSASKAQLAENALHDLQITLGGPLNKAMGELAVAFMDNANNSGSLAENLATELQPEIDNLVAKIIPLMKQFTEELPNAIKNTKKELQDTLTLFGAFGATIDKINNFGPKLGGNDNQLPTPGGAGVALRKAIIGAANGNPDFTDKGYPKNGQLSADTPTSANTVVSGGMVVLQSEADANLAAATEAYNTWREAQDEVQRVKDLATQVDASASAPAGAPRGVAVEPETKEARAARLKAEKDAEAEAERERKRIEREAKAAAEAARREAERLAGLHADLVATFQRTSSEGAGANVNESGKLVAAIGGALSNAFEIEAGKGQGAALAKTVDDLINAAVKANIPGAEEAGHEIKDAMFRALSSKSGADREAAMALVSNLGEQVRAASALNPENFTRALGQSLNRNTLGTEGASLVSGLKKSELEGTPQALDAASDSLARLQAQLFNNPNLTPEQVQSYWDRIMTAVTTTIETGGEDARTALEEALRGINVEQLLDVAGNVINDRFKDASESATRQIGQAVDSANRSIDDAERQFNEAISRREDRANITRTQKEELRGPTDAIEAARLNRGYLRDDQSTELQRRLQGANAERDYLRSIEDIRRKASGTLDGVGTASVGSQDRLAQAAAQGIRVGPVDNSLQKQLSEAKRLHEQQLADTKSEQDYADNLKILNRATAAADLRQDKDWATQLEGFRETQAKNLQGYEDSITQQQLTDKIGPGGTIEREKNVRIAAIQDSYTEQERKAIEQFNKDLARQLLLRNVGPGGAGESATREQLTGQLNQYRGMLGLPSLSGTESPFKGEMVPAGIPGANLGQGTTSTPNGAAFGGVGAGGLGATNQTIVHGNVIGVDDAAELFGQNRADAEDARNAGQGF